MSKSYVESISPENFLSLLSLDDVDINQLKNYLNINPDLANAKDSINENAVTYAARNSNIAIIELIIEYGGDVNCDSYYGLTPLIQAIRSDNFEHARLLIDNNANVTYWSIKFGDPFKALLANKKSPLDLVKLFINKNFNVNTTWEQEKTPLIVASQAGNLDIVKLLIEKSADLNIRLKYGKTPLITLAQSMNNSLKLDHYEIFKLLICSGANPNLQDEDGNTVLTHLSKINYRHLDKILNIANVRGEPYISLNFYNLNGDRAIDIIHKYSSNSNLIKVITSTLRKHGSVEPKNQITNKIICIDTSNDRLDGYEPNVVNTPKLINKLYAKFPLTDDVMDAVIKDYLTQDFGEWRNLEKDITITELVYNLINLGPISEDRYFGNEVYTTIFEFKKIIATTIFAINQCEESLKANLYSNLLNCFIELKLCKLGKLINILSITQEALYSNIYKNIEENIIESFLIEACRDLKNDLEGYAPDAFIKWFFTNYAQATGSVGRFKPEEMHPYSQKVKGIFNSAFIKLVNRDNELLDSYN
jgi:ankyrin repeat protein